MSKLPNIIISSWPSAGGSTAARFTALSLDFKYYYAGGVLKYWAEIMGYDPKSTDLLKWSDKYHDHWDKVWEGYVAKKIEKTNKAMFEGKTAGFLLKKRKKAYSIFITAIISERQKRARGDKRTENIALRDKFLREKWKRSLGVDIFNMYQIRKNYNAVIDSSRINILQTAQAVLEQLRYSGKFKKVNFLNAHKELIDLYGNYEKDSDYLLNTLKYRGLLETPREIMLEWHEKPYKKLLGKLPSEMKEVLPN